MLIPVFATLRFSRNPSLALMRKATTTDQAHKQNDIFVLSQQQRQQQPQKVLEVVQTINQQV